MTAGTLWAYLSSQHAEAGHSRHDQQVQSLGQSFENRLREHAQYEERVQRSFARSIDRIESKMDSVIVNGGHRFPSDAPPLRSIPVRDRAAGIIGFDPLLKPIDGGTP